jgi:hypothetical protein
MLATRAMFISRRTTRDTRREGSTMREWRCTDRRDPSAYWTYSMREMGLRYERKSGEFKTFRAIKTAWSDRS